MKRVPWWQRLELIRSYWPLILFIVAATAFLYTLPGRLASAEKQIEKVNNDVDDLKGWAREVQGYTRAMQQHVPNQMSRPQAPQPVPQPIPNLPVPPQTPIRVQWEQDAYGDWFCRSSTGDWWWPNEQGDCE